MEQKNHSFSHFAVRISLKRVLTTLTTNTVQNATLCMGVTATWAVRVAEQLWPVLCPVGHLCPSCCPMRPAAAGPGHEHRPVPADWPQDTPQGLAAPQSLVKEPREYSCCIPQGLWQ